MSGNFFNTNCDAVDYSTAHNLSYLVAGLNNFIIVCGFLEKKFLEVSLKNLATWV
jgi:hypothetical protein